jgi:hypothetical protein
MKVFELIDLLENVSLDNDLKISSKNRIAIYDTDGDLVGYINFFYKDFTVHDDS